jgi:outer membrane lipoprotein SlyB
MDTNSSAPLSVNKPGFAERLQHSKALIAIVAVLGVTVAALAGALVVNRSEAQTGGASAQSAPEKLQAAQTKPAATKAAHPATVNHNAGTVVAKASTCASCGTVEAVTAVKRAGKVNGVAVGDTTIGLGTVAGGVLGGVLGHQVGAGNGKTAMTVLGAAGGAYAGNKIEENMKSVTVYDVKVRMDDGSVRNVEVSNAVAVGAKVTVEGKNLRMATSAG